MITLKRIDRVYIVTSSIGKVFFGTLPDALDYIREVRQNEPR